MVIFCVTSISCAAVQDAECKAVYKQKEKKKFSILSKHRAYLSILAAHNLHGVSPLKKLDCALRPQKFGSITSFASWKLLLAGVDTMLFSFFAVLLVLQFSMISPHQFIKGRTRAVMLTDLGRLQCTMHSNWNCSDVSGYKR